MRKRFEQQLTIGTLAIQDAKISLKCRDPLLELMAALKEIFVNPKYNEDIFKILEGTVLTGKQRTGRKGMDLWQIFVLAQVRLCLNASYDRLHYLSNHDKLVRQIMGVESLPGFDPIEFEYQNIYDNVTLLDDKTVEQLNAVILTFGHDVFKKKEAAPLRLKTDTFVVKSNVHFPTDYNLLWDCARKSLDCVSKFLEKYDNIKGWRKIKDWRCGIKGLMREVGKASVSGGKNKEKRVHHATRKYLVKANALMDKLEMEVAMFPLRDTEDLCIIITLEHFIALMKKHIDLVYRRLIKGETIPHSEKLFSVFETYTEMIKKGKMYPNIEFGEKLAITTDQFNLIVDYRLMSEEQDRDIIPALADCLLSCYKVSSWSFDKGFWSKPNKELLAQNVPRVVMPKLGIRNKDEDGEETSAKFKRLKNQHSAIESNINELEHRGLDRCPDRGYHNYKRYIGLGVAAYNLKKIGRQLLEAERKRSSYKQAA